eukprot:2657389-Alexandrium_andersonii.AAC.1
MEAPPAPGVCPIGFGRRREISAIPRHPQMVSECPRGALNKQFQEISDTQVVHIRSLGFGRNREISLRSGRFKRS